MGAKVSPEMLKAMEYVRAGKSAYAAAKLAGITRGAISRSKLYKQWRLENDTRVV
jgi:hypothetical protein